MNRKKITLNEELSRMRHLLNAKSGQKMTITEINRTYIMEQGKSIEAQEYIAKEGGFWIYRAIQAKTYNMDQGQPLVVQWNNQPTNRESFIPTITQGTSPNQPTATNQELFKQLENAATAQRDSGVTTPLTQKGQRLTPEVDDIIGKAYYSMVRQPLLTTLEQQFNLPTETQRGDDFDWKSWFRNLNNTINNSRSANDISRLVTALRDFQNGLNRFKQFLTTGLTTSGRATQSTPKEQIAPVVGWASFSITSENLGTIALGAEQGLSNVTNDSIRIGVEFLLPAQAQQNTRPVQFNIDEIRMAVRNMETAFYDFIGQRRITQTSQTGHKSTSPVFLPTTNDILNHRGTGTSPKNALYGMTWKDTASEKIDFFIKNITTKITGTINAIFPDRITLP